MKRIALWDNIKFILIYLVVLGHFADYYVGESVIMRGLFLFIYFFHMPAFIYVSGIFSKSAVKQKNYQRVFEYFILYLFIKIFHLIIGIINTGKVGKFSLLSEGGLPWYAFALGVFVFVTIGLKNLNKKYLFCISVVLALAVGYDNSVSTKFVLSRIIVFYPFFLAGYYTEQKKLLDILNKKTVKSIAAILLIIFAGVIYFYSEKLYFLRPLLTGQNPYDNLDQWRNYGAILRGICYIVSFVLIFILMTLSPSKECIISKWGRHSVQVYALHYGLLHLFFGSLNLDEIFEKIFSRWEHLWIVPVSLVVTILFSMGFWEKLLYPIIKPKWER